MRRLTLLSVGCVAWMLSVAPLAAAPLTYVEVDDFFGPSAPGQDIGDLAVGVNTISGVVSGAEEFDYFRVELPTGLSIVQWQLTITGFSFGTGSTQQLSGRYGSSDPNGGAGPGGAFDITASGSPVASSSTAFSTPGLYGAFLQTPYSFQTRCLPPPPLPNPGPPQENCFTGIEGGTMSYTVSYTVEATQQSVPEPATFSLVAAGLLSVCLRRRSRRAR